MIELDKRLLSKEREKSSERYRMIMAGGRVKAAGASFTPLYSAASFVLETPNSPDASFQTAKRFASLKEKPPIEIRMAFFPQDEGTMRAAFKGLGIYRSTIKTDQGPGGNVGHFQINENGDSQINGKIVAEKGVAVLEAFLQKRMVESNMSELEKIEINAHIKEVQGKYLSGNYREAFEAIRSLRERAAAGGIETTRKAGVGRGEFFFFRPVEMQKKLLIGRDLAEEISLKTREVIGKVECLAEATKRLVKKGFSIQDAILMSESNQEGTSSRNDHRLLYFQPDILLRKDGTFDIEKINMPDLGMFLTQIPSFDNGTLSEIKAINGKIKEEILGSVADSTGRDVTLITRDEVLDNCEDTLEQLELVVIGAGLREKNKNVNIKSLKEVKDLPNGSSIILLNIGIDNSDFENLLHRVAREEIHCFPDPFVKLFEKETTTFPRKKIAGQILDKFLKVIAPSALDNPKGVHSKRMSINNALKLGGIDEDIIYFSINGNNIIPTFRYDIKSFSELYKYVESMKRQGKKTSEITAIPVPFSPDDAVIQGKDGGRLAVFRFAFVK